MWQSCGFRILMLFIFSVVKDLDAVSRRHDSLKLLSNDNLKVPLIAVLHDNEIDADDSKVEADINEDLTSEIDSLDPPHDQKAYMLYHILRTTQENENLDPEAARTLEETKQILRQALRNRCQQLFSCLKKCPRKKVYICKIQCKETLDDYNVCDEPKKECVKPQCGRTMPPSWLLLRNQF